MPVGTFGCIQHVRSSPCCATVLWLRGGSQRLQLSFHRPEDVLQSCQGHFPEGEDKAMGLGEGEGVRLS